MKRVVLIGIAAFAIFGAIAWFYFLASPDDATAPNPDPAPPQQQIFPEVNGEAGQ